MSPRRIRDEFARPRTIGRPVPALSDLSVTEFITLARMGFYPHGLVVGVCIYDAGQGVMTNLTGRTREIRAVREAMRRARALAVERMRSQAQDLRAEGVVGVRLHLEHHTWHGGHNVAQIRAIGTAVAFDPDRAPEALRGAPSLLVDGRPFTSDLSGQDFVTLLQAGYRPVALALGNCVYELRPGAVGMFSGNIEIEEYTRAFMNARESAMASMEADLMAGLPTGHPDRPVGIVGVSVDESAHAGAMSVIEYTAVGTAVALLAPDDPRRSATLPAPEVVVPVDV